MAGLRRCIYCLEEKAEAEFNREHVVPEAFGKFAENLVLDCVCRSCNDFFGATLDLKLSRDTVEGLDRFRYGLKPIDEYKTLGKRSTSYVEVMEGPLKGLLCVPRPAANGQDFDIETFLPQLGFSQTEDGPFEYHRFEELPTKDELVARGFKSPVHFRVYGASLEEGLAQLAAKGFPSSDQTGQLHPVRGRNRVDFVFKISHPEFRAISKIALNYLAKVAGSGIASMPHFNDARRYVRHDVRPGSPIVNIIRPRPWCYNGRPVRCHFVTVESRGDEVLGQVSLLGRFRYLVRLSSDPFIIPTKIQSGHVFDLEDNKAYAVDPPPL